MTANATITQMSSVATPRLTGVNRSSAVCTAMLTGLGAIQWMWRGSELHARLRALNVRIRDHLLLMAHD